MTVRTYTAKVVGGPKAGETLTSHKRRETFDGVMYVYNEFAGVPMWVTWDGTSATIVKELIENYRPNGEAQ